MSIFNKYYKLCDSVFQSPLIFIINNLVSECINKGNHKFENCDSGR